MADETQEFTAATAGSEPESRAVRRRTITFLLIFLSSVSLLLVGYQFVVNSSFNRFYLFQVAKHTSWALALVGDSSELESRRFTMDTAKARETLEAWELGEPTPTVFTPERYGGAEISAWESWYYRSRLMQESGDFTLHRDGPLVRFLQHSSYQRRIQELNSAIVSTQRAKDVAEDAKASRVSELEAQVAALKAERDALPKDEKGQPVDPHREFNFRVVSECGAIEAMAIFFSAVLAFPTRWWRRLAGILLGIPLLYGVNILRLTCLGYIGALDSGGEIFSFAHEYVWQGLYIIFVVAIWLLWVELLVRRAD